MSVIKYTFLLFALNSPLDAGEKLSIEEVHDAIEAGLVASLLKEKFGRGIDLSFYSIQEWAEFHERWQNYLNAVDAQRKFGVGRNGLCLLVAYVTEGIQELAHKTAG